VHFVPIVYISRRFCIGTSNFLGSSHTSLGVTAVAGWCRSFVAVDALLSSGGASAATQRYHPLHDLILMWCL
jgi:hypothetical protein